MKTAQVTAIVQMAVALCCLICLISMLMPGLPIETVEKAVQEADPETELCASRVSPSDAVRGEAGGR